MFPIIRLPRIGSNLSTKNHRILCLLDRRPLGTSGSLHSLHNHNELCLLDRRPLLFLGLVLPLHKFIKDLGLDESVQALIKSAQNLEESSSFQPRLWGGSVTTVL